MGKWLKIFAIALLFESCSRDMFDDPAFITNLRFTPSAFDSFRRNTELRFTLKDPASLSVVIIQKKSSRQEVLVKSLATDLHETKGTHGVTWLGDTNEGLFAPTGIYYGVIVVEQHRFETTVQVFHF